MILLKKEMQMLLNKSALVAIIVVLTISALMAQSKNKLAIVITSTAPSEKELPQLRGHYTYISDGKEIEKKIDKNGWGYNFKGEYVKEVIVQKVGGGGSYQLFIIENDSLIFESGSVNTTDSVVYRRK